MMCELPMHFCIAVTEQEHEQVQQWWNQLSNAVQRELVDLCDARWDDCFFGPVPDATILPHVEGGHFRRHDDAWRFTSWETDWREYLLEHPRDVGLVTQYKTVHYLGGPRVYVEWDRTAFAIHERPPSEQYRQH